MMKITHRNTENIKKKQKKTKKKQKKTIKRKRTKIYE